MPQQTQQMLDPFEQLKVTKEQRDKLAAMDQKNAEFKETSAQTLDQYEQATQQILEGKAGIETLSKLEIGIQQGTKSRMEFFQIAENIALTYESLGQEIGDTQNYRGLVEKSLAGIGLTSLASITRLKRFRKAGIQHNLETVLDFGHFGIHKVNDMIVGNQECYERIGRVIVNTAEELKKTQPLYERWRGEREGFERQMKELKEKQAQVVGQEFADLEVQRAALQEQYDRAKFNEDNFFGIVERAKQALETQPIHQQAYRDNVSALNQIKVRLEKDIEYYTPIFLSAQTMVETGLTTKSVGQYYKGLRMALDVATNTVQKISAGVMDESASIAEKPALDIQKRKQYRDVQMTERAYFDRRMEVLKTDYATPVAADPTVP